VLLYGLLAIAVVVGGVFALHAMMVDRNADVLLEQADAAEKKGEYGEAAGQISRYLRLRPDDLDELEHLADLIRRSSNSRQGWTEVLSSLEQVLRRAPDRHQARRTAIETAFKLRRFSDAETHLDILSERQPELRREPAVMLTAARTSVGLGDTREAVSRYMELIDSDPATVSAYAELADLIASKPSDVPLRSTIAGDRTWKDESLLQFFPDKRAEAKADDVTSRLLGRMIERGKPQGEAYLARAVFRSSHGDLPGASADVQQTLQVAGADLSETYQVAAAVELEQSRAAMKRGDAAQASQHRAAAKEFADKGLAATLPDPRLYLLIAEIEVQLHSDRQQAAALTAAEEHLRDGLERVAEARKELEPGDFERAQRLVETEVQLRWTLTDFVIDRLALAENERDKTSLKDAAAKELVALRESGCRAELVEFHEGRLLLQEQRWQKAVAALERNRAALIAFPELRERIDLLLGNVFLTVNNPDRRIEVFRRALAEDRTKDLLRVYLAKSLADAGRTDEAIDEYLRVTNNPAAALEAARLTLIREWQKPPALRDLSQVDRFLAKSDLPDSVAPGAALIRAQRAMAGGDIKAASASLDESTKEFPDEISLWQAAIVLETQRSDIKNEQKIARAEDLIRSAEGQFQNRPELRLAKMEVARLRGMESLKDELARQVESSVELAPTARVELLENLVRYAALTKEPSRVKEIWMKVLDVHPNSIPAWLALASLAIESGNDGDVEAALTKIRGIEGSSGPNSGFLEAAWRLQKISKDEALRKDPAGLAKALEKPRADLVRAADQRQGWSAARRLLGMLETLAGNPDRAFAYYQRAFELGDRSMETVRGLVAYHYSRQDFAAADAVIQQVERETPDGLSGDLARVAAQVALARQDVDAALEWTKRTASRDAGLQDKLAHAHVLFLKYRALDEQEQKGPKGQDYLRQARELYRSAIDESPDKPETWFAYIVHFWRIGDKDTALAGIEEAKAKLPPEPAANRLASLAQYYEVVQMPAEAANYFRQAVEADPSNPVIRRVAADFFLRNQQIAEANQHLDFLLDPKNNSQGFAVTWARRSRALTTAAAGRYDDVRMALNMLRGQSQTPKEIATDLRAQLAVLLGRSTLQDRRDRIEIFEDLQSRDKLTDDERLQLASLYAHTDAWPKARSTYESLLQSAQPTPVMLSEYIAAALENEQADDKLAAAAQPRLQQLRTLEPSSIRTTVTSARYEMAFGRTEAAAETLTKYLEQVTSPESDEGEKVTAQERVELRVAAEAAEELKLFAAADRLFEAVSQHAERPEDALVLATYYGRRGRYADGLDVCEKFAAKALPDATAVTAVNVISSGPVPADQLARAETLVKAAQAAEPESLRIMTAFAGLRSIQGQYAEAESLYRRVLADQPDNVAVLNNLAWLLALTGSSPGEASKLIDEAIRISGPIPALLDTRGTVALSQKRVEKGISDLQAAYADTPTPYIGYHLALAYEQAGNQDMAREHLQTAMSEGLTLQDLHPAEIETFQKLRERLGVPAPRA